MEKYLFRDGTNVIREVDSKEELKKLIQASAEPQRIRLWIFNTSEWVSLTDFNKRFRENVSSGNNGLPPNDTRIEKKPARPPLLAGWIKKGLIAVVVAIAILLVYNFTKVTWTKAAPLTITAARPENAPPVNMDSIIQSMEMARGQKLDKITRTNLRIRNTWPDLLFLKLNADRETRREESRYYNVELVLDNATGYSIDNAVVKMDIWNDGRVDRSDTLQFSSIGYASPAKRKLKGVIRGDSLSVSFSSLRARAFNFCYSSDKKSNYGNYSDRWFCK